jgi:hypothetical protein
LIENKFICMHGGIRRLINHVQQIETLQCPITMEVNFIVFMEFLWYKFCVVVIDLNSLEAQSNAREKMSKKMFQYLLALC